MRLHKNKKILLVITIIMLSVAASMNNDSTPSIEEVMDYVQSQLLQEIILTYQTPRSL